MQSNNHAELFAKLNKFVTKYYLNKLMQGSIYFFAILFIFFIAFSALEYFGQLGVGSRTFLFWSYIIISTIIVLQFLIFPLLQLFKIGKIISHKQAAKIIGLYFSEIEDKLLNILELEEMSASENTLITASIEQKILSIKPIQFNNAIDLSKNKKHVKWLIAPLVVILLLFITGKQYILTESSARIIKHNTFFEPLAPFDFQLKNPLQIIQHEDWMLDVTLSGREIPSAVYLKINDSSFKLKKEGRNRFTYELKGVAEDVKFYLLAGGYTSAPYLLKALPMPKVIDFSLYLDYPKYTGLKAEVIHNNGDVSVPQGTIMTLDISVKNSDYITLLFKEDTIAEKVEDRFNYRKQIIKNTPYQIITTNTHKLSDTLSHYFSVIKDEYPQINVIQNYDSTNAQFLFNGEIADDYLISKLVFNYQNILNDSLKTLSEEIQIKKLNKEVFFYEFNFNELFLDPGSEIKYYFSVWDNDGVNGPKKTVSQSFSYKELSKEDLIAKKDLKNVETKTGLSKSISLAEEIRKDIQSLNKSILEKKEIGWEEKQKAKQILKKQQALEQKIKNTQQKNSQNLKNQEKLNSSILEKQKQLEELMNKVLDEETKRLLEDMQGIIDKIDKEKLKSLLDKLKDENTDLEKELERELELFKQLEFEQKVEETIQKIKDLKKDQKEIKKETENNNSAPSDLSKKQNEINKKMNQVQKDLQELRNKNMELEHKNEIPNTQETETDIIKNMQKSSNALEENHKKKAKKAQEESIKGMEELEDQLLSMQSNRESDKPIEDMETLRQILENLITLSFAQEELMSHVQKTPRNSPEFVKIIQNQNKLVDDSQIIADSLFALSTRVIQMQSTINKEISAINSNMTKATKKLENRDVNTAIKRQQFVMTSTNNLALLLAEVLEQMQKDLDSPPSECNKPKNCNKPSNCKKPSISELQKAQKKLNKDMKGRGKRKKKGEGAKQLMQLAKKQEEIRRRLSELRDELGENGKKGKIDKILEDMEENETDIINNRITQETINRQKDILSRLLEAENAGREQDKENSRQSNEWKFTTDNTTEQYLEYIKQKKAQQELLKTTPLQLKPYYKKKVNAYFNTLIKEE